MGKSEAPQQRLRCVRQIEISGGEGFEPRFSVISTETIWVQNF